MKIVWLDLNSSYAHSSLALPALQAQIADNTSIEWDIVSATINENPGMQLSLFYICLKIPMYDNPPFLRGLYMCLDYNSNPVARRILLVKMQGGDAAGLFKDMHGGMKEGGELDGIERKYYEYACMENDSLRLCNIPSPQMTADDLAAEKEMLESGRIKFGC